MIEEMTPEEEEVTARSHHVGESDYSKHRIQPYDIWMEYKLDPWRADLIKRILRTKPGQRRLDLEKMRHIIDFMLENDL